MGDSRRMRRVIAVAAVLASMAGLQTPSAADTESELEAAKGRLEALEGRIEAGEAAIDRLQVRMGDLSARMGAQEADVDRLRVRLRLTQERIEATFAELQTLRDRLAKRARTVYMHGPGSLLDFFLGSETLSEFNSRVGYTARLVREDQEAAIRAERLGAELETQKEQEQALLQEEAARLDELKGQRRALIDTFARQQDELAEVAEARAEALDLVEQLKDQLAAEELARAQRIAGKGMPITFGEWAGHFLRALGAPVTRNNLVVVVAWETAEYTKATWNPLATTKAAPGATVYNSHGVRNYRSMEQGIDATIGTLRLPNRGYEPIVSGLRRSADPMETAEAINASLWCRGCANGHYVTGLIPAVEEYYDRYASR